MGKLTMVKSYGENKERNIWVPQRSLLSQDYTSIGVTVLYLFLDNTVSLIHFRVQNLCLLLKAAPLYVFTQ